MSNKFETVLKDIALAPVELVKVLTKTEKVIQTVVTEDPAARSILTTVVQKSLAIGALGAKDIAEKGLNPADDLATLTAIKDLASYVQSTLVPFIETAFSEVKADITAS